MSLDLLRKRIRDNINKAKSIVDANYPPTLTGAHATEFSDAMRDAKSDCIAILALGTFSGVTPVVQSQPSGSQLIDWLDTLASDADDLLDQNPIPPGDLQTAANYYATIRDETAPAINTYT